MRRVMLMMLVPALVLALSGCTDPATPLDELVISTGSPGGVYNRLGKAYADAVHERWSVPVRVRETPGAVQNLRDIVTGQADLAFATIDAARLVTSGELPFSFPSDLTALGYVYDDYLQIVVRQESPVVTVADLRGRPVATGARDSGTEIVAERALAAAGLNINTDIERKRLSLLESADALRAGEIDAFFFTGGLPTPAIEDLSKDTRIRLLSLAPELDGLLGPYGELYASRTIARGTYNLPDQVPTIGIPNLIVVRPELSDEEVYQLTAVLFEARPRLIQAHTEARRLDPRAALATYPLPLHPGAARYYRESKIMAESG